MTGGELLLSSTIEGEGRKVSWHVICMIMIMNGMSRKRQDGNERIEYSTKDSNKRRGEVVGDSCLAFKTSCFHNVYNKPTLFPGVVFI